MKILFVSPLHIDKEYNFFNRYILRIIGSTDVKKLHFPTLAAVTPKKHTIETIEAGIKDINFDKKYDLVGISSLTSTSQLAYKIADEFRKHGTFVVIGGWHASALPEEAKQHADAVVIGEADETWPQLLKDYEEGKVKPLYEIQRPVDLNLLPPPRNDIYPKGTKIAIRASRGCPNQCEFCSIRSMKYRNIFRTRNIKEVIEDIKNFTDKSFVFWDNSLTINIKYTKQLFREIKENDLNKKFVAMGNTNILAKDEELLKLAKEAGCVAWWIGFESISQETLKNIGKNTNKVEQYAQAIKNIHDHGMWITGWFVFGFDTDTIDVFDKTDEFVKKNDIDIPEALILTPFPGTPLYKRYDEQNRILTKDWNKYDAKHVVFQPKNMTPEKLLESTIKLHKEWYNTSNIIRRTIKSAKFGLAPFINAPTRNYYERIRRPKHI
jgi:radical SAM superfamily enzyme YgiQ (UPF0313 family)